MLVRRARGDIVAPSKHNRTTHEPPAALRADASPDGLPAAWDACWRALGLRGDGRALRDRLLAPHDEPARHYHTRRHLAECLAGWAHWRARATAPAEVGMALWFHDAVHVPGADDNERRSGDWAASALGEAGAGPAVAARVRSHVLATRHEAPPAAGDEALVVDIDLAILAAPPSRFDEYEAQVRAEYARVPDPVYRRRRRALLGDLLARPALYATPAIRDALEAAARDNLRRSIARLD